MSSEHRTKQLIKGTGVVGILTLLSRLLGFVRDLLVARLFGAGFIADAYFIAFRIPNLLRSIFAEGALTSAFVPVFATELARSREDARSAVRSVSALLLLSTVVLTLLGIVFSREVVGLFAPGFTDERAALCILLTRVMFPYIICVSLIAMLNGALNTVMIFGASAMAQVVMNLVLIGGALAAGFFRPVPGVIVLSISVVIGGVAQVVAQIPALKRSGFSILPSRAIFTPATKEILRLMAPAILGATIYQIVVFLNTMLASLLEPGSVSWLFYADRLNQLPIGIFSVALASVLLPSLSNAQAKGDHRSFSQDLIGALRYTSFFILPTSGFLYCYARPLISLLFERGAFTAFSADRTALAVQGLCLGLWGVSCHSMVVRAFIARKDTRTPTAIGVLTLLLTLFFSLLLMGTPTISSSGGLLDPILKLQAVIRLLPFHMELRHVGLAVSSSLASTVSFLVITALFHRSIPSSEWRPFIGATYRSLFATFFMIGVLSFIPTGTHPAVTVPLGALAALISYILASFLLKSAEAQETFALFFEYIREAWDVRDNRIKLMPAPWGSAWQQRNE